MTTIEDLARMCSAVHYCEYCPINIEANSEEEWYEHDSCLKFIVGNPAKAGELINKWCAEHPQKTYLQDFLEKFPNAKLDDDGDPIADAYDVYGDVFACEGHLCGECWNTVMPDEAEKEEV